MPVNVDDIRLELVDQSSPIVQLLSRHQTDKRGVIIVHLDRTKIKDKQFYFLLYFGFNAFIVALLVWRLWSGKGKYLPFILPDGMGLMDRPGSKPSGSYSEFFWTSIHILIDSVIGITASKFAWPFLTGSCWMRLRYGFRDAEPVFRSPTQGWAVDKMKSMRQKNPEEANKLFAKWLSTAVDRKFLDGCTGDLLTQDIWELDYSATMDAMEMMKKGDLREEDLELSMWQLDMSGQRADWAVWRVPS